MSAKRPLLLLLALALCLSAAACAPPETGVDVQESFPLPTPTLPAAQTPTPTPSVAPPTPEPEPEPPVGPVWDSTHRLDVDLVPPEAGELELPVYGATGYTSVILPLWENIPPPAPSPAAASGAAAASMEADAAVPVAEPSHSAEVVPPATGQPDTPPPAETAPLPAETGEAVPPPQEPDQPTQTAPPLPTATPTPSPTPTPDPFAGALAVLPAGTPFTILKEKGEWWLVQSASATGWIAHRYCMINLPDVIPSIVYDATNSYASLYTTSGLPLPGITGEGLYIGKVYNSRFDEEQYLMPVLYEMAKKICLAQQSALAEGNSLKLYEAYRPHKVQKAVYQAVSEMAKTTPQVKLGVESDPWKPFWFIAAGYSNHQRGYAIDVSLVKVLSASYKAASGHSYLAVDSYEEYVMPTNIHELSIASIAFTEPVDSYSQTAWKKAVLAPGMNPPALGLQGYCTDAGLAPLASEWWHFNDIQAWDKAKDNLGMGNFELKQSLSIAP